MGLVLIALEFEEDLTAVEINKAGFDFYRVGHGVIITEFTLSIL